MITGRMGTGAMMIFCAAAMVLSTGGMAQTTKAAKKDTATATAAKHLKPQTTCPIMGGEIDKSQYVDYKGKRIYVCCGGCIEQVKADPEGAIKKLAAMGQEPETIAPVKTGKTEPKKAVVIDTSVKATDHGKMK